MADHHGEEIRKRLRSIVLGQHYKETQNNRLRDDVQRAETIAMDALGFVPSRSEPAASRDPPSG